MILEVAFLPQDVREAGERTCVVIDVVRASSTLVVMLERGAKKVILAESVDAARQEATRRPGALLCGEAGGVAPPGFHHGNSPREYVELDLRDREIVFCTSNGTRALRLVQDSPNVLVGSLLNATAAVEKALDGGRDICLVCSGRALGRSFGIDDGYCAGYLTGMIRQRVALSASAPADLDFAQLISTGEPRTDGWYVDESAVAAERLAASYCGETMIAFGESGNGRGLQQIGLEEDLEFCAQVDRSVTVPVLRREGSVLTVVAAR